MNSEDQVVFLIAHPSACLPTVVISLLGLANTTDQGAQPLQADGFLPSQQHADREAVGHRCSRLPTFSENIGSGMAVLARVGAESH